MTCKHNKIWCAKEKALQHIFHPLSCNPAAKYQQLSVQSSQENEESSECIDTSGVEAQEVFFGLEKEFFLKNCQLVKQEPGTTWNTRLFF